jgi:hypothetical protein
LALACHHVFHDLLLQAPLHTSVPSLDVSSSTLLVVMQQVNFGFGKRLGDENSGYPVCVCLPVLLAQLYSCWDGVINGYV